MTAELLLPECYRRRATLRPSEVAELTGLPRSSVSSLLDRGILRRIKAGRDVLIPVGDVLALLSGDAPAAAGQDRATNGGGLESRSAARTGLDRIRRELREARNRST